MRDVQAAARTLGLRTHILHASTEPEIDKVFVALGQVRVGGLVIGTDTFFNSQSAKLGALTRRHTVPAVYQYREFVAAGGLRHGPYTFLRYKYWDVDAGRDRYAREYVPRSELPRVRRWIRRARAETAFGRAQQVPAPHGQRLTSPAQEWPMCPTGKCNDGSAAALSRAASVELPQ